jgi:hypothetical protein
MALLMLDWRLVGLGIAQSIFELQLMGQEVAAIRAKIRRMEALYRVKETLDVQSLAHLVHGLRTINTLLSHITNRHELQVEVVERERRSEEE